MLVIDNSALRTIHDHLRASYPHEGCGFLIGTRQDGRGPTVMRAQPVTNQREDDGRAANRYLIEPADFVAAEQDAAGEGLSVLGTYHSHPDVAAEPSWYDREHAWPWYQYLIVSVARKEVVETRAWELTEDRKRFIENDIDTRELQSCR